MAEVNGLNGALNAYNLQDYKNYNSGATIPAVLLENKKDEFVSSAAKDGSDDGKISFVEKLKHFGKGLISPITSMFSSTKNLITGAAMMAVGGALIAVTGGAIAPFMVAAGIGFGAFQLGKGIVKAKGAKTDAEAEKAWEAIGGGTSAIGLSVLGAKQAAKSGGLIAEGEKVNMLQAVGKCLKPKNISSSFSKSWANTKLFFGGKAKPVATAKTEPAKEADTPVKPATEPAAENTTPVEAVNPAVEGKPTSITKKDGTKIELEYNDNGTVKQSIIVDAMGSKTVKTYNENGQFQKSELTWEVNGQNGKTITEHIHNADGRIASEKIAVDGSPDMEESFFNYDDQGKYAGKTVEIKEAGVTNIEHFDAKGEIISAQEEPVQPTLAETPEVKPAPAQAVDAAPKASITVEEILADPEKLAKMESILQDRKIRFDRVDYATGESIGEEFFSANEILERSIQPSEITPDSMLYHGTSAKNKASIMQDGFDLKCVKRQESGKGIYFSTSEGGATGYTKDGSVISVKLAPGSKIARIKTPEDIYDGAYGLIQTIKGGGLAKFKLEQAFGIESGEELIGQYIANKLSAMGYSGVELSTAGAGCRYVAVFDPKNIRIIS